jgi:AraC-like DNA-binding protein
MRPPRSIKLTKQTIHLDEGDTFFVGYFSTPEFYFPYVFHYEIVVLCITHGFCRVLCGSDAVLLKRDDVLVVGSNTPHMTYNLPKDSQGPDWAQRLVMLFDPNKIGKTFMATPEMRAFRDFQKKIEGGAVIIRGNLRKAVRDQLRILLKQQGVARMAGLIQLLQILSESSPKSIREIRPSFSLPQMHQQDIQRLTRVFEHVQTNFSKMIYLEDMAKIAGMASTSFSRFFHQKTGKTFQEYLIDFRVNMARAELAQTGKTVTEICYECGFNNLSNFNRQFKKLNGKTPVQFRNASR